MQGCMGYQAGQISNRSKEYRILLPDNMPVDGILDITPGYHAGRRNTGYYSRISCRSTEYQILLPDIMPADGIPDITVLLDIQQISMQCVTIYRKQFLFIGLSGFRNNSNQWITVIAYYHKEPHLPRAPPWQSSRPPPWAGSRSPDAETCSGPCQCNNNDTNWGYLFETLSSPKNIL